MPDYPPLSTQVIGQTESALGALMDPVLAGAGITFHQWLVLAVTSASGPGIGRGQLATQIADARKTSEAAAGAAIAELTAAGLVAADDPVVLTPAGQAMYQGIRSQLREITTRLFDFPAEDLVTAGRVLSIVTARANALLAGQPTAT
jgi:DNA-binding MarR family transcriptional regulator